MDDTILKLGTRTRVVPINGINIDTNVIQLIFWSPINRRALCVERAWEWHDGQVFVTVPHLSEAAVQRCMAAKHQ